MQKLISELIRLYFPQDALSAPALTRHLLGQGTPAIDLRTDDGRTRAIVIAFPKIANSAPEQHWELLCTVANALQTTLGLPAPAVSVSGMDGYGLWLSLERPAAAAQVQKFVALLHRAYLPALDLPLDLPSDNARAAVELPPCLHPDTGKWSAFIHPGMGASFADESGLEMAPPSAGQAAFLEGLQSISEAQFLRALDLLEQTHGTAPMVSGSAPASMAAAPAHGLLLRDATLEDIVRFLHAKKIEPTFRHLLP